MIPTRRTFCWLSRGTANRDMMITKTKRLSTLRLYSVAQPARNSPAVSGPAVLNSTVEKVRASTT
jgi:hypothetical protein